MTICPKETHVCHTSGFLSEFPEEFHGFTFTKVERESERASDIESKRERHIEQEKETRGERVKAVAS